MEFTDKIEKGLLHNHTEHSFMDSAMTPKKLVERAAELNAPAVAITDHGTMTGVEEFRAAALSNNIKPIIGLEAYMEEDDENFRKHLILLAKDKIGEKAIGQFCTQSNTRLLKVGKLRFPRGNREMLIRFFGEGSEGHGHVIATSACIQGVLIGMYFQNERDKAQLPDLEKFLKGMNDVEYAISQNELRVNENKKLIDTLSPIASKKYGSREKQLKKIQNTNPENYSGELDRLNQEKAETENAGKQIAALKEMNKVINRKITSLKKSIPGDKKSQEKKAALYQTLKERILTEEQLIAKMEEEAIFYDQLFGHGNFFIEIQNHGISIEMKYMHIMVQIAEKHDIPYIAANDAHYARKEDFEARELIKLFRFKPKEGEKIPKPVVEEPDKELYVKSDAELFAAIAQVIGEEKAEIAMLNMSLVVDACVVEKDDAKHYPVFDKNADSNDTIRRLCYEGIPKRFKPEEWTKEYADRLEYELGIICGMGYADYHLIDQDFINMTKKIGYMPLERLAYLKEHVAEMNLDEMVSYIEADQSNIGYVIGPGRGSAAGSLVCYLLGITNLDPIKYGLLFERFLNPERVSMPDIDTDFAKGYRELAVEYVARKYGKDAVCRIVTFGTLAARGAIRGYGRVMSYIEGCDEEQYKHWSDVLARKIPLEPHITIEKCMAQLQPLMDENPIAAEIVQKALLIEGTKIQYGMHAAGVIISDNDDVSEYVPLMLDEKTGNWKCQVDMTSAEADKHLLKMDFLGLINLNIITDCLRLIHKKKGVVISPDTDISEEAEVIKAICASGKTNSIFQFESGGMKQMLKQFVPDSFEDLILLVAAYRPGPMDYIPKMIAVKHGKKPLTFATPELEEILTPTYGCIIYQEQVQQIFRKLAGYSFGQADIVRRAMSKKKDAVIEAEKPFFIYGDPARNIKGCVPNGINAEVAEALFASIREFAKYAFNKSHAAAYARVSYITAWLKYHYPEEFFCVTMEYASLKKVPALIEECKDWGLEVLPMDINQSLDCFDVNDKQILFGLTSIKGVGNVNPILEARNQHKFVSFADYMLRGHFDKSITEALIQVGAFDKFCNNRKALLYIAEPMRASLKKMKDISKKIELTKQKLAIVSLNVTDAEKLDKIAALTGTELKKVPTALAVAEQLAGYEKSIQELEQSIKELVIPVETEEDVEERLYQEKEFLGFFLSGHPMDAYHIPEGVKSVIDLTACRKVTVMGILDEVKIVQRKSDGSDMAFFTLEDKTGYLEGVCFAAKYVDCKENLKAGNIVVLTGNVIEEEQEVASDSEDDEMDENGEGGTKIIKVLKMFCNTCTKAVKIQKDAILEVPSIVDWVESYCNMVIPYLTKKGEGYRLLLHDKLFNEIRGTNLTVKGDITRNLNCFIA